MRWTGHVARSGEIRNSYKISGGKPEGERPLEGLGVDGTTLLKWILHKWDVRMWPGFGWLRMGFSSGLL
jgi:hypothetical protein